jgi:hypothetical protein
MNAMRTSSILLVSSMVFGALMAFSMRSVMSAEPTPPAAAAKVVQIPMTPEEAAMGQRQQQDAREHVMAILAVTYPSPKYIVNVGAARGDTLAALLDRFPSARGRWLETTDHKTAEALPVLGRFGNRVDLDLGCSFRDMTEPCFPPQTDVIVTTGQSIHKGLDGMYKNFLATYKLLPKGGWFINIDQVGYGFSDWEQIMAKAKVGMRPHDRIPEHADLRIPTAQEELEAMRLAGYDAQIVWQSFNTAAFMGRKR